MIAILRYAFLKNLRDGSLAAFLLGPIVMLAAPLLGIGLLSRESSVYPLTLDARYSAARSAATIAPVVLFISAFFSALAGFWSLRGEYVSRSMGIFVLAQRPAKIQAAAALFGAAAGFAGFIGASVTLFTLMAALPPHPMRMVLDAAILCLLSAAAGSLAVLISSEPWAIVPVYLCGLVVIPWLSKGISAWAELIGIVLSILMVAASTFFLERRCAT